MKLFIAEVNFKNCRRHRLSVEAIVHAPSCSSAELFLRRKFTGCEVAKIIDLGMAWKHFVVAELIQ